MKFICKKTTELTAAQKQGLVDLFNEVFDKERTVEEFDRQFLNNDEGYSYHTFAEDEGGKVVAANTLVPAIYHVGDKTLRFCNSVDTMIAKSYRGLENFYDMSNVSFNYGREKGFDAVYGFPNDNSYELYVQLKFMKDVGKLDTYFIPYRIGCIKKGLRFLNPLSMLFCRLWAWCSSMTASSKSVDFHIAKDAESYNTTRYKRGDGHYSYASVVNTTMVYKIMEYQEVRTAFIIDIYDKSARAFAKAAAYLLKHEGKNFDLILYVGSLPFGNTGMIRFPRKYEPKHFNFTAGIFNGKVIDKGEFFKIENWDVNLSNYDLI